MSYFFFCLCFVAVAYLSSDGFPRGKIKYIYYVMYFIDDDEYFLLAMMMMMMMMMMNE